MAAIQERVESFSRKLNFGPIYVPLNFVRVKHGIKLYNSRFKIQSAGSGTFSVSPLDCLEQMGLYI